MDRLSLAVSRFRRMNGNVTRRLGIDHGESRQGFIETTSVWSDTRRCISLKVRLCVFDFSFVGRNPNKTGTRARNTFAQVVCTELALRHVKHKINSQ